MGKRRKRKKAAAQAAQDVLVDTKTPEYVKPPDAGPAPDLPTKEDVSPYEVQKQGPGELGEAKQAAGARLAAMIKGGGLSPEQKQLMIQGSMAPVREEAERMKEAAERSAYERGLGQSGVVARSQADIDKATLSQLAQITGGVETKAMEQILPAVQAMQAGIKADEDTNLQFERLAAEIGIEENRLTMAMAELEQNKHLKGRELDLMENKVMNEYNLNKEQLEVTKVMAANAAAQADKGFFEKLFGK